MDADEREALLITEERKAGERQQAAATSAAYLHGFLAAAKEAVQLCMARARPFDKSMSLRMEAKKCAELVLWNLIETIECPTCGGAVGNLKCLCKGTGRVIKLDGKRAALKKILDAEILSAFFIGDEPRGK